MRWRVELVDPEIEASGIADSSGLAAQQADSGITGPRRAVVKSARRKNTRSHNRTHKEATIESFSRDPKFAAANSRDVLNDGDRSKFMTALRYVTEAFGGCVRSCREKSLYNHAVPDSFAKWKPRNQEIPGNEESHRHAYPR